MKSYSFNYRHPAKKSVCSHTERLSNDAEAIEFARGLRMGGAYRVEISSGKRQVEYRNS